MAIKGQPEIVEEATLPCKEANEALTFAIVGLFCFGIILEPIALVKASKAKALIDADPRLQGSGKVVAAIIIASIGFLFWALGMLSKAIHAGRTL